MRERVMTVDRFPSSGADRAAALPLSWWRRVAPRDRSPAVPAVQAMLLEVARPGRPEWPAAVCGDAASAVRLALAAAATSTPPAARFNRVASARWQQHADRDGAARLMLAGLRLRFAAFAGVCGGH
jgi:hypothetical protein